MINPQILLQRTLHLATIFDIRLVRVALYVNSVTVEGIVSLLTLHH